MNRLGQELVNVSQISTQPLLAVSWWLPTSIECKAPKIAPLPNVPFDSMRRFGRLLDLDIGDFEGRPLHRVFAAG